MATFHLSAPWVIFYREVAAMFKYDPQVHVIYDEAENEIRLYVDDAKKALALSALLPHSKVFGSVELHISIIPANCKAGTVLGNVSNQELFETAFEGNGAFSFARTISGILTNNLTYVVFRNRVVQYFSDDLGDIYGQCSTLYQEIAKHIFTEQEGVFFCTDVEQPVTHIEGLGSPLGEWP